MQVQRVCPVCQSQASTPELQKENLHLVRCTGCGMIYAHPISSELINGQFYDQLGTPFYLSPAKLESDYAPVRFERELRIFRRFCETGSVLDVGCSTGGFLYQLEQRFPGQYQTLGMDVSGPALQYAASRGISTVSAPFLEHDFGSRRFSAICFWAVMEHLENPLAFLARAAQLLERRGHVFILVPNWLSLATRLLGPRYRYLMEEHVNYFHVGSLCALIRRCPELEMVKFGSSHFNPMVIWQDARGGTGRVPDSERAQLLQRTTRWKTSAAMLPMRAGYRVAEKFLSVMCFADNVYVVARRKDPNEKATADGHR